LGDVVPSVEPVRSHAGVNVTGPPTLDRNAGSQRKKGDEFGIIIREGRRIEREHVPHFNVILLLNSITEMRDGVVGEGLQERPTNVRVVFRLWEGGAGPGWCLDKRETRHGGMQQPRRWVDGWMDGWIEDSIAIDDAYIASIAIRIMSDTRDEEKDRNKDERCLARHPRSEK
jgi:hypothetical protein